MITAASMTMISRADSPRKWRSRCRMVIPLLSISASFDPVTLNHPRNPRDRIKEGYLLTDQRN